MKIKIVSVGSRAPEWVRAGYEEYARRLPRELSLSLIEIPAPKHRPDAARHIRQEGDKMLAQIRPDDLVIALDERGRAVSSEELAKKMDNWRLDGRPVAFCVGGADGLAPAVRQRADETLSLSALTFPHYLVRVILAEAVYRAWSISAGHPYHRD